MSLQVDGKTVNPGDPEWPKRPDGSDMPEGAAAAFLRGKGQNASGEGGGRTRKSDGPGDDYPQVKERIQEFYATYPTGALVTEEVKDVLVTEGTHSGKDGKTYGGEECTYIVVRSAAYRTPDDPHPGRGTSWMRVPGTTPYTRGSELENAETSAWGRAIAAVGIRIDRSIASAQEILAKAGGEIEPPSRTSNADALAAAAAHAAAEAGDSPYDGPDDAEALVAHDGEPQPLSSPGDTAPEPPEAAAVAPVEESPIPEAEEATGTAPEAADVPEAPKKPKKAGKAKEEPPEAVNAEIVALGGVEDPEKPTEAETRSEGIAPSGGLSYDEFIYLAREKFIPNGHIATTARNLVEKGTLPQVGGVRELSDQDRLHLLMVAIATMDDQPNGEAK